MLALIGMFSSSLQAQDGIKAGDKLEVITNDGNRLAGTVTEFTNSTITLDTSTLGEITIQRSEVSKVSLLDSAFGYESEEANIYNSTLYFVNPSGYTLKRGQSFYQNVGFFFNSYTYGFTDNFSLTGGVELISPLFIQNFPGVFISPRYSIPFADGNGAFSIGGTSLIYLSEGPFVVGVVQGSVTLGSRSDNFTFGTGIGFATDGGFSSTIPLNFSGMTRISKSLSLVTDNFLLFIGGDAFGLLSGGLRIHLGKAALNLGLWRSTEDQGVSLAFPFVSATVPIK